jgi:hypothetical protein
MAEHIKNFLYGMGLSMNIFAPGEYLDNKGFIQDQKNMRKDFSEIVHDFNKVNTNYGKTHQG